MSYFGIACPDIRLHEITPAESAELHLRPACDKFTRRNNLQIAQYCHFPHITSSDIQVSELLRSFTRHWFMKMRQCWGTVGSRLFKALAFQQSQWNLTDGDAVSQFYQRWSRRILISVVSLKAELGRYIKAVGQIVMKLCEKMYKIPHTKPGRGDSRVRAIDVGFSPPSDKSALSEPLPLLIATLRILWSSAICQKPQS